MARKKTPDQLADIHAEALREFDDIQAASFDVRMQALSDRRFCSIPGGQWEDGLGEHFANMPRFEFNRTHLAVIRVTNEYRNNRITVDFQPKDGHTNQEMADTCDGLYRADEKASTAEEAYDNAFDEGLQGGMGAWRYRACYEDDEDDENDRQRIEIEPIHDAESTVFWDLDAKRQDKADAKRCYVITPFTHRAYEAEWGENPSSWPKAITQAEFDWCTPDHVWVCEFYRVEEKAERTYFLRGLIEGAPDMKVPQSEIDAEPDKLETLKAMGFSIVREKRLKRRVVHKYIFSARGILEDCGPIPGKNIPIVPFFAKRWVIDSVERFQGHVRLAKDAQRLENMLFSWLANMAARFDIEKPIFSPEQIANHAEMWAADNVERYPYLLANMMVDANGAPIPGSQAPVAYTRAPNVPPAMATLVQLASQALTEMLGNQQAGEEMRPNISGKAVELIQSRLDMQAFIYMSNFAKAMKRGGQIWLSMKKEIVTEMNRRMKTLDPNGKAGSVVMNQPAYNMETGQQYLENDLSEADFDVDAEVGPSSTSRRAAAVRALTGMMQLTQDPETQAVLTSLAMMNMEGEGLSDANDFFRKKMVRMGAVKPSEEEREQMAQEQANQQPDPQSQALLGMAEEAQAKAAKARADTVETLTKADLNRADTAKTYAEAMGAHNQQQIASFQALQTIMQGQPQQPQMF